MASNAAKLGGLAKALGRLSLVPSRAAKDASAEIAGHIDDQFDAGVDAYGKPWAALKATTIKRGRKPPPLTDTEEMRDSLQVKPMRGAGISITIEDPAIHHQYGAPAHDMVARPILPDRGVPDTWERSIADAVDRAAEKAAR